MMGAPQKDCCHLLPIGNCPLKSDSSKRQIVVARSHELGGSVDRASSLPFTPAFDAWESINAYVDERRTGSEASCAEKVSIRSVQ